MDQAQRKPELKLRQERQRLAVIGRRGDEQAPHGAKPRTGWRRLAEAEGIQEPGDVIASLPRPRGGSQNPSFRPRRKLRGRTGSSRVRVLVVEIVWEADIGRTYRRCLRGVSLQGGASRRCLARRKPSPRLDRDPDDWGNGREKAKTVRKSPAVLSRVSRRGIDSRAAKPVKA